MKIYFNAAVSSLKEHGSSYRAIVNELSAMGHNVASDHILKSTMSSIKTQTQKELEDYYVSMQKSIKSADLMVAEVSFPSTVHVGHELTLALDAGTPVLALYKKDFRPVLFWGIISKKFYVTEYTDANLHEVIKLAISRLVSQMDTRFNFFISPQISTYLDWVAKKKRTPKAVYLRKLLERAMDKERFEQENRP